MVFEADDPETGDVLMFRVTQDCRRQSGGGRQPSAGGQSVRFVATVADVRPASPDENLAWSRPRRTRPSSLMLADSVTESRDEAKQPPYGGCLHRTALQTQRSDPG